MRETFVRRSARARARPLGVVRRGARLVALRAVAGSGCQLGWFALKGGGYICGGEVALTRQRPGGEQHPRLARGRVLPFRYAAVGPDGSGEYLQPEDAATDYFVRELMPGNAITVRGRVRYDGEWFYITTRGTYVPASEVAIIRPSRFAGQLLKGAVKLPLAFVLKRRAVVYSKPGRASRLRVSRFDRFGVLFQKGRWLQIGPTRWLRRRDVRVATLGPAPAGVKADERWIDIDVAEQVLLAMQGSRAVFATLVSTGRRARTPLGSFRVWAKLAATDMRSRPWADHSYRLWDVPWTAFFHGAYALHGTYWHRRFGYRKSAGCVNLSPKDARRVFTFLRPGLPPGWWAILPRSPKGTLVRVRRGQRLGRRSGKRRRRARRR